MNAAVIALPLHAGNVAGHRLTPLAEKAYREIKQMILENRFHGGEYLLEDDLARMAGMSRTPLREALVQLQNDGLIAIVPRRGVRVLPLTVADMREVYEILEWLESQAVWTLARRVDRESFLAELRQLNREMRAALTAGDMPAWAKANDQFHIRLVAAAGNGRLSRICENLLDQSQRVRAFTLRLRESPTGTGEFHARMLDAIAQGDADKAVTIQRENKRAWRVELEELIERYQLRYF